MEVPLPDKALPVLAGHKVHGATGFKLKQTVSELHELQLSCPDLDTVLAGRQHQTVQALVVT